MEEPPWKMLQLSLERPYKDDNSEPIPTLLDITPEGQHIFEPREDTTSKIGENLRRIFLEKGHDFFDKYLAGAVLDKDDVVEEKEKAHDDNVQPMTPEELFRMRMEILPQLHIALGEMSQARDLLSLLLSSPGQPSIPGITAPIPAAPTQPSILKATNVAKPSPIQSVQTFNTQLVIGGKDLALRKAAELMKLAAENVEKSRARSERYWVDALKMRRGNWRLIPAPLPFGAATGRGADRTSKDFLVSFSLEESPVVYRKRAIGRIPTFDGNTGVLEYPLRQYTCLQVSITTIHPDGIRHTVKNNLKDYDERVLEESLRGAQAEVVQQEIFSVLIREASNLPTASARVSERLIVIDAAQSTELAFELVDSGLADESEDLTVGALCDLIFSALHILLLRAHAHVKNQRLGQVGILRAPTLQVILSLPPILQPIVDLLQYRVFCERIHAEIHKLVDGLRTAGISVKCRINRVGENGAQLVALLTKTDQQQKLGGETLIRIDNRHSIRFTYSSPSSLTAHLPQATLSVASIPQLTQLLWDEVGSCLLGRICEIGQELTDSVTGVYGTWFVDLLTGRTVGRFEGKALNFLITFAEDSSVVCTVTKLERGEHQPATAVETYLAEELGIALLQWVRRTIENTLAGSYHSVTH